MNATAALTRAPPELIEVFSLDDPSVVEGPRTHVEHPISVGKSTRSYGKG